MKKLIHDLHNGKNVIRNLNVYRDLAVQTYSEYGTLELTFSAYMLVEKIMEENTQSTKQETKAIEAVLQALGEIAKETCDYDKVIARMKTLREEITAKMDLFTAYTDRLICYEYVLNRMELKYVSEKELNNILKSFHEEEYMARLSSYLFADKDQSVVRDKLRLVIGQVPVHMTKNKLFEKISEALTLYKDGDRSSLDDFVYMLRTSAMVYEPQRYVGEYKEIEDKLARLSSADYSDMSEEEYEEMATILEQAAESMHEMTDFYYSLQKVVNDIYAMCLVLPYVEEESKLLKAGRSIWTCLALREYRDEMLMPLEGRIEESVEKSSYLESVLYEIKSVYKEEIDSLGLAQFFEDFALVANLLSDSLFIDLDKAVKEEVADVAYVQQCTDKLLDELSEKMSQMSRPVKRAVMGQILEKLPMMFQNTDEVHEYLRINLLGCSNKAEKAVVMTMLWDLIQEEQDWMKEE